MEQRHNEEFISIVCAIGENGRTQRSQRFGGAKGTVRDFHAKETEGGTKMLLPMEVILFFCNWKLDKGVVSCGIEMCCEWNGA